MKFQYIYIILYRYVRKQPRISSVNRAGERVSDSGRRSRRGIKGPDIQNSKVFFFYFSPVLSRNNTLNALTFLCARTFPVGSSRGLSRCPNEIRGRNVHCNTNFHPSPGHIFSYLMDKHNSTTMALKKYISNQRRIV